MKRKTVVEIAILAGVFGFFLGGLISVKSEVLQMALTATIAGATVFFLTYLIIVAAYGKNIKDEHLRDDDFVSGNRKKGKKFDATITESDDLNEIYNLRKK